MPINNLQKKNILYIAFVLGSMLGSFFTNKNIIQNNPEITKIYIKTLKID